MDSVEEKTSALNEPIYKEEKAQFLIPEIAQPPIAFSYKRTNESTFRQKYKRKEPYAFCLSCETVHIYTGSILYELIN